MANPVWTGTLLASDRLTIPVRLFAGPREKHVEFRQLVDGMPLKRPPIEGAIAKGWEYEPGKFVTVEPAEIEAPPRDTLPLRFIAAADLDPALVEATYFVHPGRDGAAEIPYTALLQILRAKEAAAIGLIVLNKRERYLAIRPGKTGLLAHTLFYAGEQKPIDEFRADPRLATPEFLAAARSAVKIAAFVPSRLIDEQSARILALLEAKVKAISSKAPKGVPPAGTKPPSRATGAPQRAARAKL